MVVTGLPRSGTSWVGTMLTLSRETVYVNEPMNPSHPPGRCPGVLSHDITHRFEYVPGTDPAAWRAAFQETAALRYHLIAELRRNHAPYDLARAAKYQAAFLLGRFTRRRALLDDPYAVLSSTWLADEIGATVIVLVRDPVSLVGSWAALGWRADLHDLLSQPALMSEVLADREEWLRQAADSGDDVRSLATLWNDVYLAVSRLPHPDVHLVRYEDLANDPVPQFRHLYELSGLTWSPRVEQRVRTATSGESAGGGAFSWHLRSGASRTAYSAQDSRAAVGRARQRVDYATRRSVEHWAREGIDAFVTT